MTDKELIKQEIVRRVESMNSCPFKTAELGSEKFDEGELYAYKQILQFIDSLPEELSASVENDCTTCINDKGCVTCEKGEMYESAVDRRMGYRQGYDQGIQDFLKKACEWLNKTCKRFILTEKDIEDFKKYMKE